MINKLRQKWLRRKVKRASDHGRALAGWESIDGWLTPLEAMALFAFARKTPRGGCVVEIGSWKGKSTVCLAKGLDGARVYAIDPFDASGEQESHVLYESKQDMRPLQEHFEENLKQHGVHDRVVVCAGFSRDYADRWDVIDFLFIDGDHSIKGTDYDYQTFAPKLRVGGYLAFHDYDASRAELGPTWVVHERVSRNPSFEVVGIFDSLWVGRKIRD